MNSFEYYKNRLDELSKTDSRREIKEIIQEGRYITLDGKKLLNLSSNDYLGISANDDIKDDFLSTYHGKIQNPSARLLSGTNRAFFELEGLISNLLDKEKTLLFNSGYHANVGIYSALLNKDDVVFIDRLNHASIIDGIHLSKAKLIPFSHRDYDDLENKLKKYRALYKNSIISSETLFSMDGDFADLNRLVSLKEKYNSILVLDEAHAFGVYGRGAGYSKEIGVLSNVDLVMGTFGKAIGSYGAFASGNKTLIDYLINFSRSFIFSTCFPEISAAFSRFVIENYILDGTLQKKLFNITNFAHKTLFEFKPLGESYIVPVVLGENKRAVEVSRNLIKNGFYILPIRYPTVKKNEARIRISLNPTVTENEVLKLKEVILKSGG